MLGLALKLVAGLAGLALIATDPAVAQTCFTLQAELEHLQSSGGGDGRRYERAYREQARVMARTERRARDAGCFGGGFMFFGRKPDRSCRTLLPKLREMQDNMVRLDRLRRRGGDGNARRVRAIRNMMRDRQCGRPGAQEARAPRRGERIFEGNDQSGRGTYRTLCVRSCDGYYFPISFSTTRQQFANDAATCMAMCPGAQADLYYHANPGSGPEDMVSIRGENYTSLPTAFQYREKLDPSCTCKPAGGNQSVAADPQARPSLEPTDTASAPLPGPRRPEPGEDPETLLNRLGGFELPSGEDEAVAANPSGSVRIVGPVFGTSPEQAGVVLTPVPN